MAVDLFYNSATSRYSFGSQSSPESVDSFSSTDATMAPSYDKHGTNYFKKILADDSLELYDNSSSISDDVKSRPNSLNIGDAPAAPLLSITTPELIGMLGGDDLTYSLATDRVPDNFNFSKDVQSKSEFHVLGAEKQNLTMSNHYSEHKAPHHTSLTRSFDHPQGDALISKQSESISPPKYEAITSTFPTSTGSSLSPINMEKQEVIKTERKRQRNRLAASKCRKRKLERISRLEDKVGELKRQNHELSSNASLLRRQVAELKEKVLSHVNSGCRVMTTQLVF